MDKSRTIKGQAWIQGDTLFQEQILVTAQGSFTNTVSLIDNIWEDLLSEEGTYKTNDKGYFYWEYEMNSIDDDDVIVKIKLECPRPKEGIFEKPYDPEQVEGKYAKFWVAKLKTAEENFEYKAAIQKKEIVFPGTEYVHPSTGEIVKVSETRVKNDDLGDITNLLGMF